MENKKYRIKMTDSFERSFHKLIPLNKQEDVKRRIFRLSEQPHIGKPLGYLFLRELKLGKFRIYYSIYEEEVIIVLIEVSNKKQQQKTIQNIKINLPELKKSVKNLNRDEYL